MQPRYEVLCTAIMIVRHNTRTSRERKQVGEKGSLLGDYLEFGVWTGRAFIHAYKRAASLMPWMRFWAFVSFQGLPKPIAVDEGEDFWEGQFCCDEKTFVENVSRAGADLGRVSCVQGSYENSLTDEVRRDKALTIASIVYVNFDLYNSVVPVLLFITDSYRHISSGVPDGCDSRVKV